MPAPTHKQNAPGQDAGPTRSICGDWTVYEYGVATSTNLVAASLPAYSAVRADTQMKGRGRFHRTWVSDQGGLWLSAVVPFTNDAIFRRALPLAVGVALCNSLHELGIVGFRLRWPNDVLVKDRKLAGLLIDQFNPESAVVGIGLNVTNHPEATDPQLKNVSIRLADLLHAPPDLGALTALVLCNLRTVLDSLQKHGAKPLLTRVNELWGTPRLVELDLDGTLCRGTFRGIDSEGRLVLEDSSQRPSFYDAHQVRHLTEIQPLSHESNLPTPHGG